VPTVSEVVGKYECFLFDLDGTLISSYMDREDKNFHAWDVLEGRAEVISRLLDMGKCVGIITNQAGVAFGYNTPDDFKAKRSAVINAFRLDRNDDSWLINWCYGHPEGTVTGDGPVWDPARRKPNPAMIVEAMDTFFMDEEDTVFIGDMESDRQAANNAGVDYIDAEEFFA
jgi:D-glycero-D-manno-heptose 1,7-bisphosphate phosphatase